MARQSPLFDYFSSTQLFDIMHQSIIIPLASPRQKRNKTMAHAEYIANAIRKDIQEYRNASFDNFAIQVQVYPVPSAFEVYDMNHKWIGFNQYIFEAFGDEPKEMFVTLDHKWNVKIRYLGAWRPVSAYLTNLKPHNAWDEYTSKQDIMHLRWQKQAEWWKENEKVFPLMKLPVEIRELVFEHIWGPSIEPYPTSRARKLTKTAQSSVRLRTPSANILRTSPQVAAEASNILYHRTPFLLHHYGVMKALTSSVEQRILIRHLELAFSHDEFMHLFSTDHERKDKKTKTTVIGFGYPALALRSLKLNSLRLTIAPPSLTTQSGRFDGACQKVAVDMIMDAAWPIIRGHPLELRGYVKDFQRKIYEARDVLERKRIQTWQKTRAAWGMPEGSLAEYDEEMKDDEVGGVFLNGSRPEIAPEQTPAVEYDLVCRCDSPCAEETWTAE